MPLILLGGNMECIIRPLSFRNLTAVAGLILGLAACSSDSPTAPGSQSATATSVSLKTTSSDIAIAAGNSIASDIQNLTANELAAVGSGIVAVTAPLSNDQAGTPTGSTPPAGGGTPNCVESSEKGVYFCTKEPGAGEHVSCKYSDEKKLFICVRQSAPGGEHGSGETCTFSASTQLYTCTNSSNETIVRSYGYFDIDGKSMSSFVKGVTASIHTLVKIDGSVSKDSTFTGVRHSVRDLIVSGFLGDTRIWNGFGSSADTNTHKEARSTRTYTGLAVDTLKAVTFAAERSTNPYPLSGVAVRVVNYTVVSTGKQTETTTVSKRIVVTFNGTADVPITLGDYSCTLHLDTKKVDGCK
jgi:hypothetical protein